MNLLTIVLLASLFTVGGIQGEQAATPQPTQTQQQPCGASGSGRPRIKLPPRWKNWVDTHTPVASQDIEDATKPSSQPPCPPRTEHATVIAPVLKLSPGMVIIYRCSPEITDASHNVSYFTPAEITIANPTGPVQFADDVQAWKGGAISCASLHKDSHGKYWAQTN